MDLTELLERAGVVPVIVINDAAKAVPLARALVAGGLPVLEVTFRTAAAAAAIAAIRAEIPEATVGAGTLLTREQVSAAYEAGAAFGVAPGFDRAIINCAQAAGLPMIPGIATASELSQALTAGLRIVKFFPAEAIGGVKMLKNLLGAFRFSGVKFMPTGGINPDNLRDYLSVPEVAACGGTWIVPGNALDANDWDAIRKLAAAASQAVREVRPDTAAADKNAAR